MSEEKKVSKVGETVYLNESQQGSGNQAKKVGVNPSYVRAGVAAAEPRPVLAEEGPNMQGEVSKEEVKSSFVRAADRPIVPGPSVDESQFIMPAETPVKRDESIVRVAKAERSNEPSKANQAMEMLSKSKMSAPEQPVVQKKEYGYGNDLTSEGEVGIDSFIESTIQKKQVVQDSEAEEKVEPKKKAKAIDLNKVNILNKTEIDKERDLRQALFNNKAAFQIVAAQSGYMAKVAPLVHKDLVNILYGNLGRFEYKKAVYKVIFDKIFDFSVGKFDFDGWLKNTSVEDMETFYYGVYSSTFPNEGTFRYTCPQCNKEHDYKVNHANLIKTTDRDHMKKLIDEVSRNSISIEKMKEYSLIGKNQAIELSESRLITELRTPSLFDSLEILRTVPDKVIDKDAISITNMLYINRVLIPSKEGNGYTEEMDKTAVLRIIDSLSIDDANELQRTVFDRVDENRITYSIKNIKCVECAHEEKDIPISIEDILFTLIFEKAQ